jgi:cation diffusion facilitator CzcD-associated flavoprotein CzcO
MGQVPDARPCTAFVRSTCPRRCATTRQHIETLVVGTGQARLATAYHLPRLGRECLVVEAADRVGDGWRSSDDSLRLYTPAWTNAPESRWRPSEPFDVIVRPGGSPD